MDNLCIGTWNLDKNTKYYLDIYKAKKVIDLIWENDLDILSLQEVNGYTITKINELVERELPEYYLSINANNISNDKKIFNVTITNKTFLYYDSIENFSFKRKNDYHVVNILNLQNGYTILNVNLDSERDINYKELFALKKFLDYRDIELHKRKYIINGTLNTKPKEHNFIKFKQKVLDMLGLMAVNIYCGSETYNKHHDKEPIDYIIVPDEYEPEDIKVIKKYKGLSSHYPVITNLKIEE